MKRKSLAEITNLNSAILAQFGIYKISSISTARIYIGSTSHSFQKRLYEHVRQLSKGEHANVFLQNHFNKYGLDDLKFEIVEAFTEKNLGRLIEQETLLIKGIPACCRFNINLEADSRFGAKWSESSKNNRRGIGNPMFGKGYLRVGAQNPMFGKHVTAERREAVSKLFQGENHPQALLKEADVTKIRMLYNTGNYLQRELGVMFRVSVSSIRNIVNRISWKHI